VRSAAATFRIDTVKSLRPSLMNPKLTAVVLPPLRTIPMCSPATDLSDYVTGAVIPIDGGLVRG
jgi:hypothetical protein